MKKHIYEQLTKLVYEDEEVLILDAEIVRPRRKKYRLNFSRILEQFDISLPVIDMPVVRPFTKIFTFNLNAHLEQSVVYPTVLPQLISFMSAYHPPYGGLQ